MLLRVDWRTAWNHVAPVIERVRAAGVFRLQFACKDEADLSYTEAEAARAGVARRDVPPAPPGWADCKLPFELAPDGEALAFDPDTRMQAVVAAVDALAADGAPRVRLSTVIR